MTALPEEVPPDDDDPSKRPPLPGVVFPAHTHRHYHIAAPMPGTLVVHTEFHRLIGNFEDAAVTFGHEMRGGSARNILDAHELFQQRKKEVYAWVVANTRSPEEAYRLKIRF